MSDRGILALGSIATPLAWAGLIYAVFDLSPESLAARVVFFVLFFVSLLGTCGFVAYFASLRLFTVKIYRGNAAKAVQQGTLLAAFLSAATLLQTARALSAISALILLATLAVAGFVVLKKQYG